MNFQTFKDQEAARQKSTVVQTLSKLPEGFWAGRHVIRDDSSSEFTLELLDQHHCLYCDGELVVLNSPSGAPNIRYYTCKKDKDHRFARVGPQPSGLRKLLTAATNVISGQPLDDDLDKVDQLLKQNMEGGA